MVRIVVLQSPLKVAGELADDAFHVALFKREMGLEFRSNRQRKAATTVDTSDIERSQQRERASISAPSSSSTTSTVPVAADSSADGGDCQSSQPRTETDAVDFIDDLPRGKIVGIMVLTDSFWFGTDKHSLRCASASQSSLLSDSSLSAMHSCRPSSHSSTEAHRSSESMDDIIGCVDQMEDCRIDTATHSQQSAFATLHSDSKSNSAMEVDSEEVVDSHSTAWLQSATNNAAAVNGSSTFQPTVITEFSATTTCVKTESSEKTPVRMDVDATDDGIDSAVVGDSSPVLGDGNSLEMQIAQCLTVDDLKWILGPFVYEIGDVLRLDASEQITCKGQVNFFHVESESMTELLALPKVNAKIAEWRLRYGAVDSFHDEVRGMSVRQPFAEAILRRLKKFENRSRALPISASEAQFCSPQMDWNLRRCFVCCKKFSSTKVSPTTCPFWLHTIRRDKVKASRKERGNRLLTVALKRREELGAWQSYVEHMAAKHLGDLHFCRKLYAKWDDVCFIKEETEKVEFRIERAKQWPKLKRTVTEPKPDTSNNLDHLFPPALLRSATVPFPMLSDTTVSQKHLEPWKQPSSPSLLRNTVQPTPSVLRPPICPPPPMCPPPTVLPPLPLPSSSTATVARSTFQPPYLQSAPTFRSLPPFPSAIAPTSFQPSATFLMPPPPQSPATFYAPSFMYNMPAAACYTHDATALSPMSMTVAPKMAAAPMQPLPLLELQQFGDTFRLVPAMDGMNVTMALSNGFVTPPTNVPAIAPLVQSATELQPCLPRPPIEAIVSKSKTRAVAFPTFDGTVDFTAFKMPALKRLPTTATPMELSLGLGDAEEYAMASESCVRDAFDEKMCTEEVGGDSFEQFLRQMPTFEPMSANSSARKEQTEGFCPECLRKCVAEYTDECSMGYVTCDECSQTVDGLFFTCRNSECPSATDKDYCSQCVRFENAGDKIIYHSSNSDSDE